ncbi:Por secretion system C-terminal sorting domain-containing protein [Saccharicrinis carchari]|uniref:Por secretion system C-terminal sorting domain-containing protein n=1 Tax=Saccharicrinis carchari TaxID=1168039 RepID=A0A521D630_SACCC|nr:InlB B-repeat-containing protein [Saccharicrinis carchari]SMO67139.1 Por secretion system C-terminal sorting domain-containing protein [Saccharicrinis carchari]
MKKNLSFLCILTLLCIGTYSTLNAQSYQTEIFTGESYSTASYVGYSHGHRSNLYKDNAGTLHLVVVDNYKLKYLTSSDEGLNWQEQSVPSEFDGKISNAMIKGNGNGDLFLAIDVRPGYDYGNSISLDYYFWRHIYVYKYTGNAWQQEAIETPGQTMGGKVIRDLLVDEDGTVHLITIYSGWWDYGGKAYEFRRDPITGAWQTITIADYSDTGVDSGMGYFSAIKQQDGSIAGLYWRNKGNGELGYRTCVDGAWGAPVVISSAAKNYMDICRHSDGNPRIVYITKSSPQKIMYKSVLDNSPGEEILTLAEGQAVNAVNVHANAMGKETIIVSIAGERAMYAEKYPEDETWPTEFQQVPLIEAAYGLSTVSSSSDALVNFSCTYIDYKKNGIYGPHGPNVRYFFNVPDMRIVSCVTAPQEGGMVSGAGQYENNAAVSLTATANSGYIFTEWSEGGTILSSENPLTFSATGNRTISAHFVPVHNIIVQPSANGLVQVLNGASEVLLPDNEITGSYIIRENENVQIKCIPGIGYHFVEWQEAGSLLSTDNPYVLTVTEDRTFTAVLEINTYNLTYTAGANGSISGAASQSAKHGQDGTEVTAVPNQGYHFVQWSDGVTTAARSDMSVQADINVSAEFAINTYSLTYTAGVNGSISGAASQSVDHGQDGAEVTAVPDQGYHFVQWSDGVTTAARTDMAVNGDINVSAEFAINKWVVTFSVTMDGEAVENALIQIESVGEDILTNYAGEATIELPNGSYTYQVTVNAVSVHDAVLLVADMDVSEAIVLTATSMASTAPSSVKVWPNPATKIVFVEGVLQISKTEIFNVDGSLIYSTPMQNNAIDISRLPMGIYIFRITDVQGNIISKRIIKK